MVLGSLTIDGSLLGDRWDYTLVAAHDIECENGISGGEVIALDRVAVRHSLFLSGNDYSCRAPKMCATILVDFERSNAFSSTICASRALPSSSNTLVRTA